MDKMPTHLRRRIRAINRRVQTGTFLPRRQHTEFEGPGSPACRWRATESTEHAGDTIGPGIGPAQTQCRGDKSEAVRGLGRLELP